MDVLVFELKAIVLVEKDAGHPDRIDYRVGRLRVRHQALELIVPC